MRAGTHYTELVFLHPIGSTGHVVRSSASGHESQHTIFYALVGPLRIPQKQHRDTLHRNYVFASIGIYGSRSVFCCVQGAEHRRSIVMLRWAQFRSHKNRIGTRYAKLVSLHPVGSMGHVVCFVAFGAQSINALFFVLGWARFGSHKMRVGNITPNLYFLH
jgi:hypothetical protein